LLPAIDHGPNSVLTYQERNSAEPYETLADEGSSKLSDDEDSNHASDRHYLDHYPRHADSAAGVRCESEDILTTAKKVKRKHQLPKAIVAINKERKLSTNLDRGQCKSSYDICVGEPTVAVVTGTGTSDIVADRFSRTDSLLDNIEIKMEPMVRSIAPASLSATLAGNHDSKLNNCNRDQVWDLSGTSSTHDDLAPITKSAGRAGFRDVVSGHTFLNLATPGFEPLKYGGGSSSLFIRNKSAFVKQENGSPFRPVSASLMSRSRSPCRSSGSSLIPEGVMMFNHGDSRSPVDNDLTTVLNNNNKSGAKTNENFLLSAEFATGGPYVCSLCNEGFEVWDTLEAHCLTEHSRNPCRFCTKTFAQKANRDRHVCLHTGDKPVTIVINIFLFIKIVNILG